MKTFDFWVLASAIPATFFVLLFWHRRRPIRKIEVAMFAMAALLGPEFVYWILAIFDSTQPYLLRDIYLLNEATFVSEFVAVGYGAGCFYLYLWIFDRHPRMEGKP